MAKLAAILIPGGAGMPGAIDIDLHQTSTDQVLSIDLSRLAPLRKFLSRPGAVETMADVEALAQQDPDGFSALTVVLANAYFMQDDVREAIGYPGQEARDSSVGLTSEDETLMQVVAARGPIYRDA
ncbi:MAG: hypothetical protein AAGH43_05325 [Pseudomonadota bacterium]